MRLADRVTILRAGAADGPYNSEDPDWDDATESGPHPAAVQPLSSSEDVVLQDRTLTRWRLFLGPAADLRRTDRVRWDGVDLEVDGDIEVHKLRGQRHHLEAVLTRVQGG